MAESEESAESTERKRGLLDTSVVIDHDLVDPALLPDESAIAAVTLYGRVFAATRAVGRTSRTRVADLLIAATAAANGLSLYTRNPVDFAGLEEIVDVIRV